MFPDLEVFYHWLCSVQEPHWCWPWSGPSWSTVTTSRRWCWPASSAVPSSPTRSSPRRWSCGPTPSPSVSSSSATLSSASGSWRWVEWSVLLCRCSLFVPCKDFRSECQQIIAATDLLLAEIQNDICRLSSPNWGATRPSTTPRTSTCGPPRPSSSSSPCSASHTWSPSWGQTTRAQPSQQFSSSSGMFCCHSKGSSSPSPTASSTGRCVLWSNVTGTAGGTPTTLDTDQTQPGTPLPCRACTTSVTTSPGRDPLTATRPSPQSPTSRTGGGRRTRTSPTSPRARPGRPPAPLQVDRQPAGPGGHWTVLWCHSQTWSSIQTAGLRQVNRGGGGGRRRRGGAGWGGGGGGQSWSH